MVALVVLVADLQNFDDFDDVGMGMKVHSIAWKLAKEVERE